MSNKKEIWKAISIEGKKPTVPYMISNHGRFGVLVDGKIEVRRFKATGGNYRYNIRQHGKNKAIFLYKEVAKGFLKKPTPKYQFVIHKDHNYLNDHVDNLKWATRQQHRAHTAQSPRSVMARERNVITRSTHAKVLTEKRVMALKRKIWDPKRKVSFKTLAEEFGVSEMQIYRIKSGEFWYHLKVENEPVHAKYKQNLSNIAFHEKKNLRTAALKQRVKPVQQKKKVKRKK